MMNSVTASDRRHPGLLRTVLEVPLWSAPFALFFGTIFGRTWNDYVGAYAISLVFTLVIRLALWVTGRWIVPALRIPESDGSWLPLAITYFISCVAASYVAALAVQAWLRPGFFGGDLRGLLGIGLYAGLFSTLFMGIVFARLYYRRAVERASQVERIRAELARAELRALRAQVNPHFLFNTLNSIAALIAENPPAAEDLVTRLAEVFRYVLLAAREDQVRFGDEMAFVRNCLAIEQARFGDRLRWEERIAPGLDDLAIPPLLLHPLVENAVRFAVAQRAAGGRLCVDASVDAGRLRITLSDDGPGFSPGAPPAGHGVGLASVRERLAAAGDGHALEIDSAPGAGARVTLLLPASPAPPRLGATS
jgi:hypothetical protein